MGLLITILLGAFVGWVASLITNRDAQQGWIGNIIVGVVGAFLGSVLSDVLTDRDRSALVFDLTALGWALAGAIALCLILNQIQKGRLR